MESCGLGSSAGVCTDDRSPLRFADGIVARRSYARAATLSEASRETADRALRRWRARGIVSMSQHKMVPGIHDAENGASTPMLMAKSDHTSVVSLARYARLSAEALQRWQEQNDPARRRLIPGMLPLKTVALVACRS